MTIPWRVFLLCLMFSSVILAKAQTPEVAPSAPKVPAPRISEINNLDEIAKNLKLKSFKGAKFTRKIKVAVLDNGFARYEDEIGKSLPKDTVYHDGKPSAADSKPNESLHGLFMAKLLAQIIAKSGAAADYELHLFNSTGVTKFTDAVDTVTRDEFDVVLYSQVWEFGGFGDGKGFINAIVDRAVQAGIIWINAAGNFGRLTLIAPVDGKVETNDKVSEEWAVFKDKKGKSADGAKIICRAPTKQKCPLRLVLSWNDFKDDFNLGTDKDLDFFLLDSAGKQVYDQTGKKPVKVSGEKNQKLVSDPTDKTVSIVPRELVEANIDSGIYKLRVKIKSKNFSASQDRLRITASGLGVDVVDPSLGETLLPPGDNPGVIVIGASDDIGTDQSKKLGLPAIYLKSLVRLKDGSNPFSTSNAAAMAAAVTVLNLGTGTEKTRDAVTAKLKTITQKPEVIVDNPKRGKVAARKVGRARADYRSVPNRIGQRQAPQMGGPPMAQMCLVPSLLPVVYPEVARLLGREGASVIAFAGRAAIAVNYNFPAAMNLWPQPFERIFITPYGVGLFTLDQIARGMPVDYYEVISTSAPICL